MACFHYNRKITYVWIAQSTNHDPVQMPQEGHVTDQHIYLLFVNALVAENAFKCVFGFTKRF